MTVREEARQRIEQDPELIRLRKKIESGKATYSDTAAYSNRAGKLVGEVFSRRLPEIPPEEREPLCVELLHDRYIDINAAVDTAQRFMDEALGIQIAPQHAPFDSERGHQIGSSLRDPSKPVETLQRRARAATETTVKSMHDDRMKSEAKFRSRAGLKCFITRKAVSGCCAWCTAMAGRYAYGEEPDDIYRRHDNCDCTVTFENGRKRQDVWSKREWEAPEPGAGAGDAVVLTEEQAEELQHKKALTFMQKDDTIRLKEAQEYLNTVFGTVDKSLSKLDRRLVIENAEQLKKLNDRFGVLNDQNTGSIFSRKSSNIAETYTNLADAQTGLMLSRKYYATYDTLIATEKAGRKSFLYMPSSDEFLSVVSITHEYGHMLENAIIRSRLSDNALSMYRNALIQGQQANARNYLKYEESIIASDIRDEIIRIAKESDPNFSLTDNLSRYGRENNFEFFAEVFANSQCGAPNALGKAMNVWFERSGL